MRVDKLRNKIIDGEIKIPPFQRKFVWKKEQVVELLDSIYNDYPVGSILLSETSEELPSKRNVGGYSLPESKAEYPINYILDGQQRVTSIFGVFCYNLKQDNKEEYDENIFDVHFDLDEEKFVHTEDLNKTHSNLPLKLLFNNFDFNVEIREYTRENNEFAVRIQSIFQNYDIPTITIKKRTKSEVGVIFERINNTGTQLSTLDLMIAWTWKENYHLKDKFDEIYELLEVRNFGGIKQKIILQCFGAIIKQTTVTKEILDLQPEDVRNNTEKLKKSLEQALDYLYKQFNVLSEDFLPKPQHLVPLTFLFSEVKNLTREQGLVIKKWFWRTAFSDRYSSGTDKKMDEDIQFFKEIINNDFSQLSKYHSTVNEFLFKKQLFSKSNSSVRAFLLMLSQRNPKDLTNGELIDTGLALSSYNRKEYHHVFPRAYLKDKHKLENSEINVIANFCFLPANSNKKISDKQPSIYFFSDIPKEGYEEILNSNLLPKESKIYEENNYTLFLEQRAELLLNEFLKLSGLSI